MRIEKVHAVMFKNNRINHEFVYTGKEEAKLESDLKFYVFWLLFTKFDERYYVQPRCDSLLSSFSAYIVRISIRNHI